MYRLTEKRLANALPILERHSAELARNRSFNTGRFEMELRSKWGIGAKEFKQIMVDMLRDQRFRLVAAYHMQNDNTPGPAREFQRHLADLYGSRSYQAKDIGAKRDEFWRRELDAIASSHDGEAT